MHISQDKYLQIADHYVMLPTLPQKSEILFINEKKVDSYWQRDKVIQQYPQIWFDFIPNYTKMWQTATLYNQDGLLITLSESDSNTIDRIYQQETYRRLNGVWFKNADKITWITGDHYFFLMYGRMQRHDNRGSFADYRKFQSDYFYLVHHARVSPYILGLFCSKPKKTGITNAHWSGVYLNRSTVIKNQNLGYMNINQEQAAKTFNDYFMYSYNGLISPLKPKFKTKSENNGSIVFAASYRNSKQIIRPNSEDESELNSSVFCVPTKAKAFDVAVMNDITFDEPTKYLQNFGEIWRTNKEAVKIQKKFNGRAWLFNYTPEEDSESFLEARKVFKDSELKTIVPNTDNQTTSGLINFHIPAYAAWEGAFDKYGYCDEEKARKENQKERDKAGNDKRALQAIIRQYANDKREAWGTGGISSVFDPIRMGELIYDLDELLRTGKIYEQGQLLWKNPLWEVGKKDKRPKGQFGDGVKYVPLTKDDLLTMSKAEILEKGRLRSYEPVLPANVNRALRYGKDEYGNLLPPPKFDTVGAIDPTDFRNTENVEDGSFDAMYSMPLHDEIKNVLNRRPVTKVLGFEYLFRPENPEEFYQDVVKFIIYTGGLFIVEANNGWLATRLEDEGLGHYMLWRNKKGVLCKYTANHAKIDRDEFPLKHISTQKNQATDTVSDFVLLIKNYLQPGNPAFNEIDYGKLIKSMRLLEQLKDVDLSNTKRFDCFMAFGYLLMCHEAYLALLLAPADDHMYQASQIQVVANALFNNF